MKRAKIQCNRIIAQAKKTYWTECLYQNQNTCKVWNKVNEMTNGYKLQTYPIELFIKMFPSRLDKAEAFAIFFTKIVYLLTSTP